MATRGALHCHREHRTPSTEHDTTIRLTQAGDVQGCSSAARLSEGSTDPRYV